MRCIMADQFQCFFTFVGDDGNFSIIFNNERSIFHVTINQTGRELEGMLLLGLFYLVTSLVISGAMNIYNNSVKLKER